MDKPDVGKSNTHRDVLKLAGTAAAFCTSFGFLHGGEPAAQLQDKHQVLDKHLPLFMPTEIWDKSRVAERYIKTKKSLFRVTLASLGPLWCIELEVSGGARWFDCLSRTFLAEINRSNWLR